MLRHLIFAAWLLCLGAAAHADSGAIEALSGRAQQLQQDIAQLESELGQVSGERQASLQQRNIERRLELLALYDQLTEALVAQRETGQPIDATLAGLAPDLLALGPQIRKAIEAHQRQVDQLDQQHEPQTSAWVQAFIDHSRFIDEALGALSQHTANLQRLGLNNDQSLAYLQQALPRRAEVLAGLITLNQKQARQLQANPDQASTANPKLALAEMEKALFASLKHTIGLLDAQGLDSSRYREILITSSGDISAELLDAGLIRQLTDAWLVKVLDLVKDNGVGALFKLLMFLAILTVFYYLSRMTRKLLRKSLRKATVPVTSLMEDMLVSMSGRLILLVGLLIALGQLGISLGPVLAGLGVAGFIVGFAMQDTLSNFAAGMMILIYRPYDVGDLIEAAGVSGQVKSMSLVSTTVATLDNQTLIVPNSKIWGDVIRNVTAQQHRRVDMSFGIGYGDDIAHAERVLVGILQQHPKVLEQPEFTVKLHKLNESSVDFIVRPWVNTADYWEVYWDVTRSVKERFDAEGISIPFPQRDLHLYPRPAP